MKICPDCKAENKFDGAQYCKNCGAPLGEATGGISQGSSDLDNDLEFEVTETTESQSPQPSGIKSQIKKSTDKEELLEIKDNANLLEDEANGISKEMNLSADIPQPAKPPNNQEIKEEIPQPVAKPIKAEEFKIDWSTPADKTEISSPNTKPEEQDPNSSGERENNGPEIAPSAEEFSKSRNEVNTVKPFPGAGKIEEKSISQNVISSQPTHEPDAIEKQPALNKADLPASDDSNVKKSSRVRGKAFYYKNVIQLAGNPFLHENDEILYNNKPYQLKPYRPSKRAKQIGIATAAVILLIILATQIFGPTLPGYGQIVGLILDRNSQPYLGRAKVSIPELGKSAESNEQGFFRFDEVPTGTYEIIIRFNDNRQGTDYITVTDGSIILRTFGNLDSNDEYSSAPNDMYLDQTQSAKPAVKPAVSTAKQPATKNETSPAYGKIKLESNVEDAKFVVDGRTLGAGNNTYTKIKSGQRKVQVSKPGYTEFTEVITVSKNKTYKLKANLARKASDKNQELTASDYFGLGNDSFLKENYQSAIGEYSKAIGLSPNYIDAYSKRAQSYAALGDNDKAASDYIRLGEIYNFRNRHDMAISQFASALKYSANNTIALVGRGNARMDKGEYRSALFDFIRALEIDEDFYPARLGAGIAEYKLGDTKNADKHFKNAKKLNSDDPVLYQYMMLNYLVMDNVKQVRKTYAQYKTVAGAQELAEFKSSGRFEPILRLIDEEDL